MKIITQRDLIRTVAKRFRDHLESFPNGPNSLIRIASELEALDPETATHDQVADIILNESWTEIFCCHCGESVIQAVYIPIQGGKTWANLCFACVDQAAGWVSLTIDGHTCTPVVAQGEMDKMKGGRE